MIRLWLPGARPTSPNRSRGEHWGKTGQRKGVHEERVLEAWVRERATRGVANTRPATATLTFINHYARLPLDWDNMGAGLKGYIDGLVKVGIIADDNPSVVLELRLRQKKVATVKEEGIEILVEEA